MSEIFEEPRMVTPDLSVPAELISDQSLRPQSFSDFIGQKALKDNLAVYIEAAKRRNEALDHCLFAGPPGLGKTTLAYLVAKTIGSELFTISGPALDKKGDLAAVLTNLKPNDVLFIDEIHRVPIAVEEVLYSAMEDFKLDIILGQGPGARTMRIDLPKFTLIGATTRSGLLSTPLRDRFGINFVLEFYQPEDIQKILMHSASRLNVKLLESGAKELAHRSRGTPRIANRLLRRVRDFAEVGGKVIDEAMAKVALTSLAVDECGLDAMDKRILMTIIEKFDGGPVGLDTLASAIGEEAQTIEDVYEPFLLQQGFIHRTPRGRIAARRSYEHFGLKFQPEAQPSLEF
ncbi:MAG: Holliday junction branch migration DNA helicase RuvB [Bdellovibrionota bacterium]